MSDVHRIQYALLAKSDWDHQTERLQDCPGSVVVSIERLGRWVQAMTGRGHMLANGNIGRKLRDGKRVYIAPKNSDMIGLLIQKVSD